MVQALRSFQAITGCPKIAHDMYDQGPRCPWAAQLGMPDFQVLQLHVILPNRKRVLEVMRGAIYEIERLQLANPGIRGR